MTSAAKAPSRTNGGSQLRRVSPDGDGRFRSIFEGAAIGIATCTLDSRILETNATFARMLSYHCDELVGVHIRELGVGDFQQEGTLLKELGRDTLSPLKQESRYRRKDGSHFWAQLTTSVVHDPAGEPSFLIALLEDTTENKRAAEKSREAEKMEVIGRLAGGTNRRSEFP